MENHVFGLRQKVEQYESKLKYLSPARQVQEKRTRLMQIEDRLCSAMENRIFAARQQLGIYIERMKGLSPLDKLNQGFSYVENKEAHAVTSISQVEGGEMLNIQVTDGKIGQRFLTQKGRREELEMAETEKNMQETTMEDALKELDGIVERLEGREISLEDSFALYQKGMELLKSAEAKLTLLRKKCSN